MKYNIKRKDLDNNTFLKLRKYTETIVELLSKRLSKHLTLLRPLFTANRLFGVYVKSSNADDMPGSDKAFAHLQQLYSAICEVPFNLPKKLKHPLAPISSELEFKEFEYIINLNNTDKKIIIINPTKWIISYCGECSLSRLNNVITGKEHLSNDDMIKAIINHIALVVYIKHNNDIISLFEDLGYLLEIIKLENLGNLPVVTLQSSLETFLPTDDFISNVTQLSGISAFQEIIEPEAVDNFIDPLSKSLKKIISS